MDIFFIIVGVVWLVISLDEAETNTRRLSERLDSVEVQLEVLQKAEETAR